MSKNSMILKKYKTIMVAYIIPILVFLFILFSDSLDIGIILCLVMINHVLFGVLLLFQNKLFIEELQKEYTSFEKFFSEQKKYGINISKIAFNLFQPISYLKFRFGIINPLTYLMFKKIYLSNERLAFMKRCLFIKPAIYLLDIFLILLIIISKITKF